jgi:flagellar hook-length control protein FliK
MMGAETPLQDPAQMSSVSQTSSLAAVVSTPTPRRNNVTRDTGRDSGADHATPTYDARQPDKARPSDRPARQQEAPNDGADTRAAASESKRKRSEQASVEPAKAPADENAPATPATKAKAAFASLVEAMLAPAAGAETPAVTEQPAQGAVAASPASTATITLAETTQPVAKVVAKVADVEQAVPQAASAEKQAPVAPMMPAVRGATTTATADQVAQSPASAPNTGMPAGPDAAATAAGIAQTQSAATEKTSAPASKPTAVTVTPPTVPSPGPVPAPQSPAQAQPSNPAGPQPADKAAVPAVTPEHAAVSSGTKVQVSGLAESAEASAAPAAKPTDRQQAPPEIQTPAAAQTVSTATGPAAVRPAATPAVSEPAGQQIAASLAGSQPRAGQQVTIRLDPPELGKVKLTFHADGNEVRGTLEVESTRTMSHLQREMPSLMQRLTDSGIQMRRLDFVLSDGAGQQSPQGSLAGGHGFWNGPSGGSGQGGAAGPEVQGEAASAGSSAAGPTVSDTQINVWL